MLALYCIVLAFTGLTTAQGVESGEMSFAWQELSPNTMRMVPLDETWMSHGFSFSISTNNASTTRVLSFIGQQLESLGFLVWNLEAAMILDAEESDDSCGVALFSELDVADMSGVWRMGFEGGNLSVSFSNGELGVELKEVLNESVTECAGWLAEAQMLQLSDFSDQSTGSNDSYKYSNSVRGVTGATTLVIMVTMVTAFLQC